MRSARVILDEPGHYHCISRTVNREFRILDREKEKFVEIMRKVEAFSGCTVLTFAVMTNHFHILLATNEPVEMGDEELLQRVEALYGRSHMVYQEYAARLMRYRERGQDEAAEEHREQMLCRMHNVSAFMKDVKQRFAQWYNKKENRSGPFWSGRFKSVLVEPDSQALSHMACYIDLNPVRAKIVEDPKDYRWNGYGEAVAGGKRSREGLLALYAADSMLALGSGASGVESWSEIDRRYRMLLYERGIRKSDLSGRTKKPGFSAEDLREVLEKGGRLTWHQLVCCRVKYLTDSVIYGSKAFVEKHEELARKKRKLVRRRLSKPVEVCTAALSVFQAYRHQLRLE